MSEEVKKTAVDTRPPGTDIVASAAVVGAWYVLASGEIERCVAVRSRGRGVQVGFVGLCESEADADDIRWIQGKTSILVANEATTAQAFRASVERLEKSGLPVPKLPWVAGPRNGLLCPECGLPQRETPGGACCENPGHGGLPGVTVEKAIRTLEERANQLGADGYNDEAKASLREAELLRGGEPAKKAAERLRTGLLDVKIKGADCDDSAALALDAAHSRVINSRPFAGPDSIFHKSLHVDWRTPKALFDAEVRRWGPFYLDCAATEDNKLCEYALTPKIDALSVDWEGTEEIYTKYGRNRWLNHPYSKGEEPCPQDRSLCKKKKCVERGYHIDQRIASSGEWMKYARDQVLKDGILTDVLTKAAIDTTWWRDTVRRQAEAGRYVGGEVDPNGGPAAEFLNATSYKAATWFRLTWERLVVEVVEIEGRVDFDRGGNDGGAGFASALVTFYRPGRGLP